MSTVACKAYRMRAADPNRTWESIGEELGVTSGTTYRGAQRWAALFGLPWPIPGGRGTRGRRGYELRRQDPSLSWEAIAERVGAAPGCGIRNTIRHYARTRGLPWPLPRTTP